MTMGPLPMTRIVWMSSRLGISGGLRHQRSKLLEEVARVMGAGGGFGVVLHAEGGEVVAAQTLQRVAVQIPMRERDRSTFGVGSGRPATRPRDAVRRGHREAVVVAGD